MIELNKIYNEDCLTGMKNIPDNFVDIVITSPPYNKAGYEGFIRKSHCKDTWTQKRNIDYNNDASVDFLNDEDYQKNQIAVLNEIHRIIKPDGIVFYNHKVRIAQHKASHPIEWLLKTNLIFRQQLIWKRNGSPAVAPIRFLPDTELIFVLTKSPCQPNFNRINGQGEVFSINFDDNTHPAPFPERLIYELLQHCGGNVVLDPYMGSGTVAVVSKKLNKQYIGFELFPEYIKMAEKRISSVNLRCGDLI